MKVNDRVTVKTDGGPRRPGVVLAVEEFSEGTMYRVSLEDYPLGIWFFNESGHRGWYFCREGGAGLIEPDWRYIASPDVSAHVNKNAVSDVICQPYYVIDHLFIMRFYLSFYIPLMGGYCFCFNIHSVRNLNGSLTFHPHSQHAGFSST